MPVTDLPQDRAIWVKMDVRYAWDSRIKREFHATHYSQAKGLDPRGITQCRVVEPRPESNRFPRSRVFLRRQERQKNIQRLLNRAADKNILMRAGQRLARPDSLLMESLTPSARGATPIFGIHGWVFAPPQHSC